MLRDSVTLPASSCSSTSSGCLLLCGISRKAPEVLAVVLLVLKHSAIATGCQGLDAQVYPNRSTVMGRCLMLHLDRDGDEPPARLIGKSCAHDFALETQFLSHVDIAQLRDSQRMPMN